MATESGACSEVPPLRRGEVFALGGLGGRLARDWCLEMCVFVRGGQSRTKVVTRRSVPADRSSGLTRYGLRACL
jgi:hypothetical protein